MHDQNDLNQTETEIERVRRQVDAVRERIRALNQSASSESDENQQSEVSF
jgi:uncharacterized coiled-coil protein SlyX